MGTQHTPGPWFVSGPFIGPRLAPDSGIQIKVARIAGDETDEEPIANARLIAAAPDGFALAQLIVTLTGNVDHSQGGGENAARMYGQMLNDIRDAAEKLIAKASA